MDLLRYKFVNYNISCHKFGCHSTSGTLFLEEKTYFSSCIYNFFKGHCMLHNVYNNINIHNFS